MIIVETKEIPTADQVRPVPLDRPMDAYKVFLELSRFCDEQKGVGISAVQVGLPMSLFLVRGDGSLPMIPADRYGCFVNCRYEPVGDRKVQSMEGCLSLRDEIGRLRSFLVDRHETIRVTGHRLVTDGAVSFEPVDCEIPASREGIIFQHEIDHHFGTLISDIGRELFIW